MFELIRHPGIKKPTRGTPRASALSLAAASALAWACALGPGHADSGFSPIRDFLDGSSAGAAPLTNHPTRLFQLETANTLPQGAFSTYIGTMQTNPNTAVASGTGNQVYFGGGAYAPTERLSFGIDFQSYRDPTINTIGGVRPNFFWNVLAGSAKYQVYDSGNLAVAAQASAEYFVQFDADLWGGVQSGVMAGSVKVPVSYRFSPAIEVHLTPSASFFPETIGGAAFYGTILSLGAGASVKASDRQSFYGAVDVPLSGNNNINSAGAFTQVPVWTAGGRFLVSPKVALDAFVTNGIGVTPATSILTHWPDGEPLLFGAQLTWTPGANYPDTFRASADPATGRQVNLQADGFTVASADTLDPGTAALSAHYGSHDSWGLGLVFSPDQDGNVEFYVEDYADDGSVAPALVPTTEPRYMFGPKLRFMDQNNGDPFSLSARALFGRQIEANTAGVGVFFAEAIAGYQVNDRLSVTLNPKLAAFGRTEVGAFGAGVNFELSDGLDLIAEAAAVGLDGTDPTWAAGVRYTPPGSGFSVDAHATNAIGRTGIGTMIAQDSTRYSISLTKRFNLTGLR